MNKKVANASQEKTENHIKWESSDAFYLRRSLANAQRKLNRFNELASRMAIEAPDLQAKDLIARIKKRKTQLIKEIAAAERKSKKKHWSGAIPMPPAFIVPPQIPPEFWGGGYRLLPEPMMRISPSSSGYTKPAYLIKVNYQRSWLCHDSTATYAVDDQFFEDYATIFFRGELIDDASIWRDDNPDTTEWGTEAGYHIPPPEYDAIVSVEVSIRVISEFTNAADDGGYGYHSVAFAHTDPKGHMPGVIFDVHAIQFIMLSLNNSKHYDSNWQTFQLSFNVKRGITAGLAILLVTYLSAQDGKVESLGHWQISQGMYYKFERA